MSQDFNQFIRSWVSSGGLKQKYVDIITDNEGMKMYTIAFTHESANPSENYEFYEKVGDKIANACIAMYIPRRFPQLACPKAVPVFADLTKFWLSKQTFSKFSESRGAWKFVIATQEAKDKEKKSILEDVFESFIGVTCLLCDDKIKMGIGYAVCYDIIKKILDNMEIPLEYTKIVDPVTRLKNFFDQSVVKDSIGVLQGYESSRVDDGKMSETVIKIKKLDGTKKKVQKEVIELGGTIETIGKGKGSIKDVSDKNAAQNVINKFKSDPNFIAYENDMAKKSEEGTLVDSSGKVKKFRKLDELPEAYEKLCM